MSEQFVARHGAGRFPLTDAPLVVRMLLCLVLGICAALGQAPFDLPLVMILSLAAAFAIWRAQPSAKAAWWTGWAFGSGYFGLALIWIVEPFQVDVGRHGWMAPFALAFMSAGLALFWAAAFWGAQRLSSAAITLVLTWTMAEVLRAYVLTGFPWASPAQVLVDGPASRLLAYAGPHGATFALMLLARCLSLPASGIAGGMRRVGQAALLIAAGLALHLPQTQPASPATDHVVRLVQPNAAQHLKWQPELAELFYERQLSFTAAPGSSPPDLVVWPETAIPWRLERAAPVLAEISATATGRTVVLGALRTAPDGVRNALAVLGPDGTVTHIYDKHHLVPFGEYIPFARLAGRIGFTGLAARGAGFSPGPGPALVDLGPLGLALPLICYEAVFAHEVNRPPERPEILLQITNDAWFGDYAGPQQHLAQARMRAIEQGLPLLRAANTGISAVIDPLGRITASLPMGVSGFVDAALPAPAPPTLYSRAGDLPVVLVLLLGLFAQWLLVRRHRNAD